MKTFRFWVLIGVVFIGLAAVAQAQTPRSIVRRVAQRRADAARAVQLALRNEQALRALPPRAGSVAVIADSGSNPERWPGHDLSSHSTNSAAAAANRAPTTQAGGPTALTLGLADLLATDLARIHALHPLERLRAQAIVEEQSLAGVDAESRPRSWRLLGAANLVMVQSDTLGGRLRVAALVVDVASGRAQATRIESGALADLFAVQRRLSLQVVRALGVEPTAAEVRAIADRPVGNVNAFMAWTSAMEAVDAGDTPHAERLLRQALDLDPGINGAFDAAMLVSASLTQTLANVTPLPSGATLDSDDPSAEGLATEGNESEFGESWLEVPGAKRELRLYEATVPLSASLSLGRGRFDVSTLWASSRADTPANDVFHAWGFTDVHLRYVRPISASGVSLSVGAALPSRDAHGADDDIRRVPVSPDLLPLAMFRRRNAPSLSGGLFWAGSAPSWSYGVGAGTEWTASYDEVTPSLHTVSVSPGLRWRLRADAERRSRFGSQLVGVALTGFSAATKAGARITGGERLVVRVGQQIVTGRTEHEYSAWWMYTAPVIAAGATVRPSTRLLATRFTLRREIGAYQLTGGLGLSSQALSGVAGQSTVLLPQASIARSLGSRWQTEMGADYVTGTLHEPGSTLGVTTRGWSLRAVLRYEP